MVGMINLELYQKIMDESPGLSQNFPEWKMYLNICYTYLEQHNIKKPIVVELGTLYNRQKRFYEQLLGAEHIGIDSSTKRCVPDIQGLTSDIGTLNTLKERLAGRPINILFIDASHRYKHVKSDFDMYHPLCENIVAFHDIEVGRETGASKKHGIWGVWRFWDELKELSFDTKTIYKDYLFMSIRQCRLKINRPPRMGIGMIIKK